MFTRKNTQRVILVSLGAITILSSPAQCQDKKAFDGPYAGITLDRQNTISGALINGVDVLRQKNRAAINAVFGFRKKVTPRFVLAGEVSGGWLDGNLALENPSRFLSIEYDTSFQYAYGGHVGYVVSEDSGLMAFIYGKETTRKFDLAIDQGPASFTQSDKQGLFSYGLGIEKVISDLVNIRATLGTTRVDYDDRITNIDPENRIELGVGAILQF